MYTHNNFCTSVSLCERTAAINMKRASILDLISQATYTISKKFKKRIPTNIARGNQTSNIGWTGPKAHSGRLKAHQILVGARIAIPRYSSGNIYCCTS